jgi:hypothetical protein
MDTPQTTSAKSKTEQWNGQIAEWLHSMSTLVAHETQRRQRTSCHIKLTTREGEYRVIGFAPLHPLGYIACDIAPPEGKSLLQVEGQGYSREMALIPWDGIISWSIQWDAEREQSLGFAPVGSYGPSHHEATAIQVILDPTT